MRKIISVILAALMLFSVMAVSASAAAECTCGIPAEDHDNFCLCCIYCPGLPQGRITSCAEKQADGTYKKCCGSCEGYLGADGKCGCSCDCCAVNEDGTTGGSNGLGSIAGDLEDVWDEDAQNNFVDGFQAVLKKISDVFDRIFDAIFEFLRLDEVLGRN